MRNKLILFLMLALFGSASFLRADEVQIGVGGTSANSYLPSYSLYNYSLTQQIYTAEEIGVGECTINSIAFYNSGSEKTRTYTMYLVNTDKETFSGATDWIVVSAADQVFTGTVTMAPGAWNVFTLDTPFDYTGENLALIMDDNTGSWSSGLSCYVFDATAQALRVYSDGTDYDPMNPGTYNGTLMDVKNQLVLDVTVNTTPVGPVVPTGEFGIAPADEFALLDRAINGWSEPFPVRIYNGGVPATVEASLSGSYAENPFYMLIDGEQMMGIDNMTIDTDEDFEFSIVVNPNAPEGDYNEEFTLFYALSGRDIITIPVTGTLYTAVAPDIVEVPGMVTWSGDSFTDSPIDLHANYNLYGMTEMKEDAVYRIELADDYRITASGGDDFIAIYNAEDAAELNASVEPVLQGTSGIIDDEVLLAGNYYMVVASNNITDVNITRVEIPEPTAITYVAPSPDNGEMEVEAPVTLAWTGGENATEYQVLFGTFYPPTEAVVDWTMVDDNYGSYTISELASSTQYFWQIKARNSKGTVEGPVYGFTTTLVAPNTVTASAVEIFTDETTLIKWKHSAGAAGVLPETQIGSGTTSASYLPTYNLYNYSYTQQIFTAEEIGSAGTITSISFYAASNSANDVRNLTIYMVNTDKTSFSGGSDWEAVTSDDIVYTGTVLFAPGTWTTLELTEPFSYDGTNLLVAVNDLTGSWTSSIQFYQFNAANQAIRIYQDSAPYNPANPGSGTVMSTKNQIILNKEGAKSFAQDRSFLGFNVYYGQYNGTEYEYTKANDEIITEKQYLLGPGLPYDMDGLDIKVAAVYDEGESGHSTPDPLLVQVSGYGTFTGTVTELISTAPVAGVTVKFNGQDEFGNSVSFQGTTNASGVYTINNVKAGNYIGVATLEGMEPRYSDPVTLAYNTTETVDFVIHEEYKPVLSVYAEELDPTLAKVTWSMNTVITGGGSGSGGSGTTFTEGFEGGMPSGWTVIDANNDGNTWCLTSAIPTTWTYYASLTLDWYRTGTNAICSGSYINGVGAITPNDYLVTSQVNIVNGSTFKFWGAATDESYPADHFGVAVSDNGTDWTMVQEWTMTAKGAGNNGGRASRDGNGGKLGTWHEFSVDLSAYTGQKYIAIRHFNCTDQYIMCIDDIELTTGSKDRSVQNYTLVRKAILLENGVTPADSVTLAENYTDTLYADFDWYNREPGLYQYGVSAHYPTPGGKGNRDEELTVYEGTTTNNYVPMFVFYFDDWTRSQYIIPAADLADMNGAQINAITFYTTSSNIPYTTVSPFDLYLTEVDYTTISAYVSKDDTQVVYSGTGDFVSEGDGGIITITFDTPYTYNGGNLLVGCDNTTDAGYKNIYFKGQTVTGASISGYNSSSTAAASVNQRNFIPQTTFSYMPGAGASNDDPVAELTWSNILPKDMDAVVIVNAHMAAGSTEGVAVNFANDFESGFNFTAEMDETGTVTFDEFRKGNYTLSVTLPDYVSNYEQASVSVWNDTVVFDVTLQEVFKPVEVLEVSGTGYARWTNMLPEEPERVAERYHVTLEDIFQGLTTDNYMQLDVTNLTVGQSYTAAVAVVYTTGMSDFVTKTFTYLGCEATSTQVEDLEGHSECDNVVLTWNGGSPTPGPGPGPGPSGGTLFTEGFESGLNGWHVLTVLADGGSWIHSDNNLGGYDYTELAHGGTGFAMCYSFVDYVGSFNTDSYLYTPQKYDIVAGSTLTFYADNANDSYPENFSVCVATADNPTASDFTQVWSGGAKGSGEKAAVRHQDNRYENWRFHSIDLSAYAGQSVYIAFHDVNYDMYEIWIDDVELTGAKGDQSLNEADWCGITTPAQPSRDMWDLLGDFDCTSGYQYGVATDGTNIYTSSWSASSTSMFYKYDMDGNFIEEFNISGCGQIRDLTYDGQYFYGVANSATIYCIDLANHALIGQTSTSYGAMRCCSYDPQRDGFWVVGNWSGNLTLLDRTGAIVQAGPAPESASGVAYFKDDDNVEHVYCFNNGNNGVYDYNITTNVMGGQVFNFNNAPGAAGGSSGGCHVGNYNGKLAFFGDMQQSPNYIAIYELSASAGPSGGSASAVTPGKFNIFRDGEVIGATNDNYYSYEAEDNDEHYYEVYYVDANYNFSCAVEGVYVTAGTAPSVTNLAYTMEDPYVNLTWEGVAETYVIYRGKVVNNQVQLTNVGETTEMTFTDELPADAGMWIYVVQSVIGDCQSDLNDEIANENYVAIDYDALNESEVVTAVYPNPTSGDLHINANGMTRISVVNALGQVVYNAEVDTDEVVLNMGQYNAGIYMVNIVTVNGTVAKRVVVTK